MSDMQEKLDELRARKAVREDARAKMVAEREVREEAAFLELEETHGEGKTARVNTPGGMVVIKMPTRVAFKKARDKAAVANAQTKSMVAEQFAREHVIYPSLEAYDALCDDYPGVPMRCSNAATRLTASAEEDEAGK